MVICSAPFTNLSDIRKKKQKKASKSDNVQELIK